MSLFLEHKYTNLLSVRFDRFTKKSARLYNCKCPICLDSKKNKSKARGYFYVRMNRINYKCHNCGASMSLGSMLKEFDPTLYKQYVYERYASGENGHSNYKKPDESVPFKSMVKRIKTIPKPNELLSLDTILKLPEGHFAKEYIRERLIPKKFWSRLYYAPDFKAFIDEILPNKYPSLQPNDARLIIPFYTKDGTLFAIQGRSLGQSKLRYITIKLIEEEPKIYGMDKVNMEDDFYITEGPFDSMFVPNCIAAGGADIPFDQIPKNGIFIFDNEPSNKEILKRMEKVMKLGYRIFIWPPNLKAKDINDAIMKGTLPDEMFELIQKRTYDGLKAKALITKWRR